MAVLDREELVIVSSQVAWVKRENADNVSRFLPVYTFYMSDGRSVKFAAKDHQGDQQKIEKFIAEL